MAGAADGRVKIKHCTSSCFTTEVDRGTYMVDVKQIVRQFCYFKTFKDKVERWPQIQEQTFLITQQIMLLTVSQ